MNATTQIVWNGCDGYIDIDSSTACDYDITRKKNGSASLFTRHEQFNSFPVVEVDKATIPVDEDGDMILDGLFVTDDYRVWRAV